MAARRSVSLEPIVDMINVQMKRLKTLRKMKGANKARVDLALKSLSTARKKCLNECKTDDFFVFAFPGEGSKK